MNDCTFRNSLATAGRRTLCALALVAVWALAACSDSAEPTEESRRVQLNLTLALPAQQQALQSRAVNDDWSDYAERDAGTEAENAIDLEHLSVLLYDANGNSLAACEQVTLTGRPSTDADGTRYYPVTARAEIPAERLSNYQFSGRVVVLAGQPAPTAGAALSAIGGQFSMTDYLQPALQMGTLQTTQRIPMYGTLALTDFDLSPGVVHEMGTIAMLRALAKVTVELSADMQRRGWALATTTLGGTHATGGNLLPAGYADVTRTEQLGINNTTAPSFNPLSDAASTAELAFSLATGALSTQPLYLPEQNNSTAAATIALTLSKDGAVQAGTYTLRFVQYTDGLAGDDAAVINIVRNHWYRFIIYKGDDLRVDLRVEKWNPVTHELIVM